MAITVIKRPEGYRLSPTTNTAVVSSSSGALFTNAAHNLTTGDYIYVYSSVSSYNGYWYVSVVDPNTFRIREYATASDVAYFLAATVTYYENEIAHNWSCVHLPIVYKLSSDIWPTNGTDTARTITTFTNYNGYTYLVLSGDIKSSGNANSLEEVVLSGTSVDGVYQILNWISETNIVIDLPYSAGNVLSTGTAQYYYQNYHAKIAVYAKKNSEGSYELINTIKAVPDSSGIITINIADYLKSKIDVLKNDTIGDYLPVNDDAFCYFYISVAESYLDSNGYTVIEYTSSYTSDGSGFIGTATNSMLPFKTRSGGFMSEYYDGYYPSQKFLTAFTTPVLTPDNYFDLSFIRTRTGTGYLQREVYVDDVLKEVYQDSLTSTGILRMPIERSGWNEDRIDATIYNTDTKTAALTTTGTQTQTIGCYIPVGTTPNGTYSYSLSIASAGGGSTVTVSIKYNGSETIYSQTINTSTSASGSNIALPAPAVALATSIDITVTVVNGTSASRSGSGQVTLISQVSETLSIDVDTDCSTQDYYLTWLNIYGGFDYWNFKARKTYSVDVFDNTTSDRNIYTNWPNSYSEFADTITEQTSRRSKNVITVSSQYLTTAQEDAIKYILSSPLVQVVVSKYDKRTIIVNPSSYKIRKDQDDTRSISFEIAYTDNIPSQSL